jgi:hypothetical protein
MMTIESYTMRGTGSLRSLSYREASAIAYDAITRSTVLFGGISTDGRLVFGDTWIWDGEWHAATRHLHLPPVKAPP